MVAKLYDPDKSWIPGSAGHDVAKRSRFGWGLVFALATAVPAHAADVGVPAATRANLAVIDLGPEDLAARKIERVAAGELEVPTGRIVATDPLVFPERAAFERTIPPGRYGVKLYKAQGRFAIAELRVAPGKVARWEAATAPGQDAKALKDDEIYGYGVDAGLGSFMDAAANAAMETRRKQLKSENYYDDVLSKELSATGADHILHRPLADDPVNVAIFSSGWGDGFYASYWGFDATGAAIVLATDFQVLEDGDGRSDFDRRHEATLAAMTPEQQEHAKDAYKALKADDIDRLRALLAQGLVTPETYIADAGDNFVFEAIRLDKPEALEHLVRYGATPRTDPQSLTGSTYKTYFDYARKLDEPLAPDIEAALPKDFKRRPPSSAALKDVLARWEAGQIPLAPGISKRGAIEPAKPATSLAAAPYPGRPFFCRLPLPSSPN